jgi:nicotinate-nucleotide adenylyltransferase
VLYGGSFDPPHLGHQMACLYWLEGCGAEQIWLIPSATHPFGKPLSAFPRRQAMCQAMAEVFGGRVQVQSIEAELGGAGRTFDTVAALQQAHPGRQFALGLGTDLRAEVGGWHRWEELQARLPVSWVGRGSAADPQVPFGLPNISSRGLRARLAAGKSIVGLVPVGVGQLLRGE